jgi:hypothetical protein
LLIYINHLLLLNLDLATLPPSTVVPASIFLVKKILKIDMDLDQVV